MLEQFESVYERYLTLGQMGQEIKEMMIRQRNIAFHRSRLNPMDEAKLREDIQTWRQLQQQKQEKENASHKVPMPAIVLLVLGVLLILGVGCVPLKGGAAGSRNRLCDRRCPAGAVGRRFLDAAAQKYSGTRTGKNRVDAAGYSARLPAFR